jgi:hypothetical protein
MIRSCGTLLWDFALVGIKGTLAQQPGVTSPEVITANEPYTTRRQHLPTSSSILALLTKKGFLIYLLVPAAIAVALQIVKSQWRTMASAIAKKQAGVGEWKSPITSELITAKVLRLSSPAWTPSGGVLFLEGRPLEGGRNVAVVRQVANKTCSFVLSILLPKLYLHLTTL